MTILSLNRLNGTDNFFRLLVFLFPVGMGTVQHWTSGIFYTSVFVALLVLGRRWSFPSGEERSVFIAFVAFFAVAALSLVNGEDHAAGIRRLEKLNLFLLFIPLWLAVRKRRIDLTAPFLCGLLAAGPLMAAVAYYSVHVQGLPRAKGFYHPIIFGDLSMVAAVVVLAALATGRLHGWMKPAGVLSLLGALYASALSGTRGAWIVFPVVAFFLLWVLRREWPRRKTAALAAGVVILCLFSPALLPDRIGDGLNRLTGGVESYAEGEDPNSSEGQRLMLWKLAIEFWRENPILGTGLGDFRLETARRMESGLTQLNVDRGHAHNIFLDALATTGILGLSALILALFFFPARVFSQAGKEEAPTFAVLGGHICLISFAIFGLTEGWLARSPLVTVYLLSLLVFMSALPHGEQNGQGPAYRRHDHEK